VAKTTFGFNSDHTIRQYAHDLAARKSISTI